MKYENTKDEKKARLLLSLKHQYNICASLKEQRPMFVQEVHAAWETTKNNMLAKKGIVICLLIRAFFFFKKKEMIALWWMVICPTWGLNKITALNISSLAFAFTQHFFRNLRQKTDWPVRMYFCFLHQKNILKEDHHSCTTSSNMQTEIAYFPGKCSEMTCLFLVCWFICYCERIENRRSSSHHSQTLVWNVKNTGETNSGK